MADPASKVALLIVHGIGSQKRGETLTSFLRGFRLVFDGVRVDVDKNDPTVAEATLPGRTVRMYEVHWATEFSGKAIEGTFKTDVLYELAWFPLLNHRAGLLEPTLFSRRYVLCWTIALIPTSLLIPIAHFAAVAIGIAIALVKVAAVFVQIIVDGIRRRVEPAETYQVDINPIAARMDETVGDIFNYVASAARASLDSEWLQRGLAGKADEILNILRRTAERAVVADGCTEVQVIAHSLGALITYHCLTQAGSAREEGDAVPSSGMSGTARLTRLYTLGSPISKIGFFWPTLMRPQHRPFAITSQRTVIASAEWQASRKIGDRFRWYNLWSPLDIVSGRLVSLGQPRSARNMRVVSLGGLLTSHVSYHTNLRFMALVGMGLTGTKPVVHTPLMERVKAAARAGWENLLFPAIAVALVVAGVFFAYWLSLFVFSDLATGFVRVGFEWGAKQLFPQWNPEGLYNVLKYWIYGSVIFGFTVLASLAGYSRAAKVHAEYWSR